MNFIRKSALFIAILFSGEIYPSDTLFIDDINKNQDILKNICFLEDANKTINFDSIYSNPHKFKFQKNIKTKLNFGFTTSTYWLKLTIKNISADQNDFILLISNPDLNYIDLYELINDTLRREFHTGEYRDVSSREIFHRNFAFNIDPKPQQIYTFYFAVNNSGGPLFIPISLKERSLFVKTDNFTELIYWSIYGLLIFIFIFNLYLYKSIKDKVNLYYALYVLFATIFFFYYDGYFYFFNPPVLFSKFKFLYPSLYTVFLLSFTQAFAGDNPNYASLKKFFTPLKIIALSAVFFNFLPYPLLLAAEIGVPVIIISTFLLIISIAIAILDWKYSPSVLLLSAYIIVLIGLFIQELKEFGILPPIFIVENSAKFGLTVECIIITIAVLERFRINQEKAKSLIHENFLKIEGQNKELEIINVELEKLSIVASETNNNIAIYDKNGRLELCNSGFEKFYGFSFEELLRSKRDQIEIIIPNKDIKKYFTTCLNDNKPISFETKVITNKNNEKWVQTTLTPYPRRGKITKIIAIDSDITDLKKYEKELEIAKEKAVESDRLKTVFLGNMSHEIRTPLNGILGFTELLGRTSVPDNKKERYYKLIMSNGEQLTRIIDDIVDISLIESNQLKMDEIEFDFNILINEVIDYCEMYKSEIGKSNIHIILQNEVRQNIRKLYSDPVRLKQVLMNLLKNSLKFTLNGYIRLECTTNHNSIRFIVEDTGIGIEPEKAKIIFDRFRQGDESLSRKFGGTGLGLSISKGIIDKLGGRIWIDEEYRTGLRICFEIPQTFISSTKPLSGEDEKMIYHINILQHKKFLVVEDDDTSYELLTEILSPFDINITHAINGFEAIEYAKERKFDVILMDINLPILDGVSATKEIRKFNSEIFILAQTAYAMKIEKDNILASGCNDIICKPLNSDELLDKIAFHFRIKA